MFFLIAILGILAAIAIPNFLTAMQRAKQKRTMADIRTVATALEAYASDKNQYPLVKSVADLQGVLAPTYIRSVPVKDGWAADLVYQCWSDEADGPCTHYALGSGGKDMDVDRASLREYAKTPTSNFDCDIVFADGEFVQYPDFLAAAGGQ